MVRKLVTHFSSYDDNAASKAIKELAPDPPEQPESNDPCERSGSSTIRCESQSLGETVDVGAETSIAYISDRQVGYIDDRTVQVDLIASDTVNPAIREVQLVWQVAGREIIQQYPNPQPDDIGVFTWDGLDRYGRPVVGEVPIRLDPNYIIVPTYQPFEFPLPPLSLDDLDEYSADLARRADHRRQHHGVVVGNGAQRHAGQSSARWLVADRSPLAVDRWDHRLQGRRKRSRNSRRRVPDGPDGHRRQRLHERRHPGRRRRGRGHRRGRGSQRRHHPHRGHPQPCPRDRPSHLVDRHHRRDGNTGVHR